VSRPDFEAFLARLYVDGAFRAAFLADPRGVASALQEHEIAALEAIDRHGLALAAASFEHKRAKSPGEQNPPGLTRFFRLAATAKRFARWLGSA
jgi:hypothetical protein